MLEAIGLTKRYEDGLLALDHLDLVVTHGELFCLLGANGAGKTTTVNLFLDFISRTEGVCRVDGVDVAREPLTAKRLVSYVSENVMLYDNFTPLQNLDFFAQLGRGQSLTEATYRTALRRAGLREEAFRRPLRVFSKGMRQKLGIAIAMIKDAPNLLMDEPTVGLDPKAAAEFMGLLGALKQEGRTILMATHDVFRARQHADRIGIMKQGRLVMVRTSKELAHVDLERLYLDYMDAQVADGGDASS